MMVQVDGNHDPRAAALVRPGDSAAGKPRGPPGLPLATARLRVAALAINAAAL